MTWVLFMKSDRNIALKVFEFGIFLVHIFHTFGLNTERYRVSLKKETLVQMFSGESCEIS